MARRKSSCRYCGKLGHTRRGCKDYKDYLKREMEAGSYWAKEEYTRNTQTKCSYCQTYGHNRRVCDGRKGDIKTNSQEIYDTRLKIRERLRDIGLGSGALVQYETSGWVEDGGYVRKMTVGPLLDVDWDNVTQHDWPEHSYYGNSRSSLCQVYHTKPTVARATRGWAPSGPYKVNWPIEYEGGNSRDGTCIVSPSYAEYDDKWFTKVECNKTAMAVVDAEFNRKKKR
jgi:hypothetical protein